MKMSNLDACKMDWSSGRRMARTCVDMNTEVKLQNMSALLDV